MDVINIFQSADISFLDHLRDLAEISAIESYANLSKSAALQVKTPEDVKGKSTDRRSDFYISI